MKQTLYFSISPKEKLSEKEKNLVNTIIVLICAHTNSRLTGKTVVIEDDGDANDIFQKKLFFQEPVSEDILNDFYVRLEKQFVNAFKTSKLEAPSVNFIN